MGNVEKGSSERVLESRDQGSALDREIQALLTSPATSTWLKESLGNALARDCVDAANDVELLSELLSRRCEEVIQQALSKV